MKNVLILGANGNIARLVTSELADRLDVTLLLTSRKESAGVLSLDVLDLEALQEFMSSHPIDIVYANLGVHGQQVKAAQNVIAAMEASQVKRLIWVATAGIYDEIDPQRKAQVYEIFGDPHDPTTYFGEQSAAAKLIEASDLDYTILRPNTLTDEPEIEPILEQRDHSIIKGGPISRRTVAHWISQVILEPTLYSRQSVALSKQ